MSPPRQRDALNTISKAQVHRIYRAEGGEITRHLYNYTFDDNSSFNLRIYDSH